MHPKPLLQLASTLSSHNNTTSPSRTTPPSLPLTVGEVIWIGFSSGIILQIGLGGLTAIASRYYYKVSLRENFWTLACIMAAFNFTSINYQAVLSAGLFYGETASCLSGMAYENISAHVTLIAYDIFLLYKTFVVSEGDLKVYRIGAVLLLFRVAWAIWDICVSRGSWDPVALHCDFSQDLTSVTIYTATDILIATVCTAFSLLNIDTTAPFHSLLKDNTLRCLCTITITSYLLYTTLADQSNIYIVTMVQAFLFAVFLNGECFWFADAKQMGVPVGPVGSAGTGAGSMIGGATIARSSKKPVVSQITSSVME
ncbi:hypothetical protein HDU98_006419 [Podochytrium sp. JEL0797]|nr:hypothetical protein HDU98_006419 [Podochytrium sp. JEL0797]